MVLNALHPSGWRGFLYCSWWLLCHQPVGCELQRN